MLLLAEKPWRRGEVVEIFHRWVEERFLEAGGEGDVKVGRNRDGWIVLEAGDEILLASLLRLSSVFDPISHHNPPHTAKVLRIGSEKIFYEYPLPDGSTVRSYASTAAWAAYLGLEGIRLQSIGIVGGGSISVSRRSPSVIERRIVEEILVKGLDAIILIDLSPQEAERLAGSELKRFIAQSVTITPLVHIVYLRLGTDLRELSKRLDRYLSEKAPGALQKPLSWRALLEKILHSRTRVNYNDLINIMRGRGLAE